MLEDSLCDECENEINIKKAHQCLSCGGIFCKDCGLVPIAYVDMRGNHRISKSWLCPVCGDTLWNMNLCDLEIENILETVYNLL
jgi:hypothetical protein